MRQNILFFSFLIVSRFCFSQALYFPPNTGNNWDTLSPSALNWCPTKIDSLYAFLDSNNTKSFILLKNGKIVLEKYFGTHTQTSNWYWASAGKTLTAFMVGIAQQENHLSLSDTSSNYLGLGWTNCSPTQEEKITIRNQLTMTSGLDDASGDPDCTIDTCLEYLANAGSRWAYHNAPYTLLDSVISQATGMSLNSYFTQKVKNPIGMNGFYFYQDYNNVFFSTARSMARFGLLLLNEGNWNGNQILTDQDYFTEMTSASQSLNPAYGYLTWLNNTNQFMAPGSQIVFNGSISPDAPAEMYAAMGKNGQFINIVQSEDLVWARMGDAPVNDLVPFILNNEIWQHLNQLECQSGGVFENEFLSEIKLTPNPASNYVEVNTASPIVYFRLEDIRGNLIELKPIHDTYSKLDLSDLEVGTYFLRLTLLNGVVLAKRFVKY